MEWCIYLDNKPNFDWNEKVVWLYNSIYSYLISNLYCNEKQIKKHRLILYQYRATKRIRCQRKMITSKTTKPCTYIHEYEYANSWLKGCILRITIKSWPNWILKKRCWNYWKDRWNKPDYSYEKHPKTCFKNVAASC